MVDELSAASPVTAGVSTGARRGRSIEIVNDGAAAHRPLDGGGRHRSAP